MNSHPALLWLQQPPRSQLSTFQQSYHFTLLGAPFEPVSGFRLTACNSIGSFILTTFTLPYLRTYWYTGISTSHSFRAVHSESLSDRLFGHSNHMATPPALSHTTRTSTNLSSPLSVRVCFARLPRAYNPNRLYSADAIRSISESPSGRYPVI